MDSFTLSSSSSRIQFLSHPLKPVRTSRTLLSPPPPPRRKPRIRTASASKNEPNLDEWDRMELKFGRMIGEDPKLTMAKIMGKKLYPDLSYLEIEKLLEKRKGKPLHEDVEEVPFDVTGRNKPRGVGSARELNLVRPVPPKGAKFEAAGESAKTKMPQPQPTNRNENTAP
ncbi:hypothetical protein M569_15009, partial [Genlisea aurea]